MSLISDELGVGINEEKQRDPEAHSVKKGKQWYFGYKEQKIYCPSLAEQKRVANVLDKLESKLFVEQELLASFNQQKLYLLGKMFI